FHFSIFNLGSSRCSPPTLGPQLDPRPFPSSRQRSSDVPDALPSPHEVAQRQAQQSARLVLRGIALNAALAAVKFAGGILGNTYALIADGAESTLDIVSSLLVWAGFQVAARPPDAD